MALSYALVTNSQVADHLGVTLTATEQTVVDLMIDAATRYAERYIGRHIKTRGTDATHTFDITVDTQDVYVTNYPLISVTSVTEDGDAVSSSDYYQYNDIGRFSIKSGNWQKGRQILAIVYEGGYATVPEDLQQWCIGLVAAMFRNRGSENLESETVGSISVSYVENYLNANPLFKETLNLYKSTYVYGLT